MASLTPTLTPRDRASKPKYGGGNLPPVIEFPGYGGDEGGRDDKRPHFAGQLRRYRLGMMVGLVAVTMLFVAFTATYMFRHALGRFDLATGTYVNDWLPLRLPLGLLIFNTAVLALSSITMEKARRAAFRAAVVAPILSLPGIAADDREPPWVPITAALGLTFLGGQFLAWHIMQQRGFFLASGPSSSFFYVLTALHGIHLFGGILALLYAVVVVTCRPRVLERRRIVVDVTAWYWHFMGVLWAYIFAVLLVTS